MQIDLIEGSTKIKPTQARCFHCGELCREKSLVQDEKTFCCSGCRMVYGILNKSGLCDYYEISEKPGIRLQETSRKGKFDFLDHPDISAKLVRFREGNNCHVTFYLPQIHCSSCIWLLERIGKLHPGILHAHVNFLKKEADLVFKIDRIQLSRLAELLASIGYEPHVSLNDMENKNVARFDKKRIYKLGIAGFCFGNIMMLSFPEYFSSGEIQETLLKKLFSYANFLLSLPVLFYCAEEFFTSAWKGLRQRFLNIDAPIAIAILITFTRSVYEIFWIQAPGYLDSMSGIVFFMLAGRYFQAKSYDSLAFDRDYTSYFPLGITRLFNSLEEQIPVSSIRIGDRLRIHSMEIIPCDGMLIMGKANIDYSFVTGESAPVAKGIGELLYAGGKQMEGAIEIESVKEVSQSYLTSLWKDEDMSRAPEDRSFVHRLSRYFTCILFGVAIGTGVYWAKHDPQNAWHAITSVLIVACPCALLLSSTFTNGAMLSRLSRNGLYVKNASVLEKISSIDTIVFDKTGTITVQDEEDLQFKDGILTPYEENLVRSLATQSNHPLSRRISSALADREILKVKEFEEIQGGGCSALINGRRVRSGSANFVQCDADARGGGPTKVYVSIDGITKGYFQFANHYRAGLKGLLAELNPDYRVALITGDNDGEQEKLSEIFGKRMELRFHQDPWQKMEYIRQLRAEGHSVLMVGDGLNDAGALRLSDAGIAVSDNVNNFSPACDAILDARQFSRLNSLIRFCRLEKPIIRASFAISILYNVAGLYFAVRGELSPVIAAVLMPASSFTIILFTTGMSRLLGRRM
jgi:Cu+-exporting ATPase